MAYYAMAKRTLFAEFRPIRPEERRARHLVAVVAFDGVLLGNLSTACEAFERARRGDGRDSKTYQRLGRIESFVGSDVNVGR